MTEQGLGISCLPGFAVQRQLKAGTLKTVLDDYVEHSRAFHMLWPSGRYTPPKLRVFVDFMAENLFAAAMTGPSKTAAPRPTASKARRR